MDAQPRTKKGHPPQSTTGVAERELDPRARALAESMPHGIAGNQVGHRQEEERHREDRRDPEPARHVVELGVRLLLDRAIAPAARAPCRRSDRCRGPSAAPPGASGRCTRRSPTPAPAAWQAAPRRGIASAPRGNAPHTARRRSDRCDRREPGDAGFGLGRRSSRRPGPSPARPCLAVRHGPATTPRQSLARLLLRCRSCG